MRRIIDQVSCMCFITIIIVLGIVSHSLVSYAESCQQPVAKAVSVQGIVEVQSVGKTEWLLIKLDDTFCPGDNIRVKDRSRADLTLLDKSVIILGRSPENDIVIDFDNEI